MANTNKTKAEILQELESIKGLLLEHDDIPILRDTHTVSGNVTGASLAESKRAQDPVSLQPNAAAPTTLVNQPYPSRPAVKPAGENPFLPQHIRERLHGNNPPPLFEYEAAKKMRSASNVSSSQSNSVRKNLVDEVIKDLMPQIETELRHRLFGMSVQDLEKILGDDDS